MNISRIRRPFLSHLLIGVSSIAISVTPQLAFAQPVEGEAEGEQPAAADDDDSQPSTQQPDEQQGDAIVVTGIRASLEESMDIKRYSQGVVDAISAEDMGDFPDTNLAEALQRITGVSIDRSIGEGSKVTVRGFGPEFNLVLLNGRQMPASSLGGCCEAPASRSFDFANIAAEGIALVEVFKSGRATLPTGGIGSVINIVTPRPLDRPGMRGSISLKGVIDTSRFEGTEVTPEVSGIISNTFADERVGILVSGSYQRRKASIAQFNAGWREGLLGSASCNEGVWGALPLTENDWCGNPNNITNRPGPTDVYQTTQNAGYDFTDIDRERINGQVILQVRPTDSLTASIDYTFSQNTVEARTSSIGVWFNHAGTTSAWTDGPAAGPIFYSEAFGPGKDLAITGALAANRNINHSIGGRVEWKGLGDRLSVTLDAHNSTAESKPTNDYGTNIAVGSAIFGVQNQTVNFDGDMPTISYGLYPGFDGTSPSDIRPAGSAFRNAYMKDRIQEASLRGNYNFDTSLIKSLDFGVTLTHNKVRSAYGFIQTDDWGGTMISEAEVPDDIYTFINLPGDRLSGMDFAPGNLLPGYFEVDTESLIALMENLSGICSSPWSGTAQPGTCLAEYQVDRRIDEKTVAPFVQSSHVFNLFGNPGHLFLGLRYEKTKITSSALVPIPAATSWVADNEISIIYGSDGDFSTLKGDYDHFLPAIDFDMSPRRNVKLRASYSHTISRPDYASMQGGLTLASPIRVGGGTGSSGNPALLPYLSKNIDLSAEWYYAPLSYVSIGFFHKRVSNFISQSQINAPAFDLRNPALGPRVAAARAALGANATTEEIRAYIAANYPGVIDPNTGGILGQPDDPLVNFVITQPVNSDQKAKLHGWEFAIQHSFWDTGFGAILNYTIVNGDATFDNTLPWYVPQFALTGLSDSANAILYYDKNGIQARVAYNWRDKYLGGYGFDPFYVEPYGQVDVSASYEFRPGWIAVFEGINVTNSDRRGHMRNENIVYFASPGKARYSLGVRFTF